MSFIEFKEIDELTPIDNSQISNTDNFVVETNAGSRRITFLSLLTRIQSSISSAIAAATSSVRGGVKTNTTSADPVVYLKSEVDTALNGKVGTTGNQTLSGQVNITNTTASTSNTTGALTVAGGVGIGGDLEMGTGTTIDGRIIKAWNNGNVHSFAAVSQSTSTNVSAANLVSTNPNFSAVQITGNELQHGTLKISHEKPVGADGNDATASALSIDIKAAGNGQTAAQGIFINATEGATTGNLITVRNDNVQHFRITGTGRLGVGRGFATPGAKVDVQSDADNFPSLVLRTFGTSSTADLFQARRASDSAVRTKINANAEIVTSETIFLDGAGVQVGSINKQFGGGDGVIGITNAVTVPTTNPTGGGVLFSEAGSLKWLGSSGSVVNLSALGSGVGDLTAATVTTTGTIASGGSLNVDGLSNLLGAATVGTSAGTSTTAYLLIRGAAGNTRDLRFQSGNSDRWRWRVNNDAESGSNAGSSLQLNACTDAGGFIDSPLNIVRAANGTVTIARPTVIGSSTGTTNTLDFRGAAGSNRDLDFQSGTSDRWTFRVNNETESGSNAGSNFQLIARSDAGTQIDIPFSIGRAAGSSISLNRPLSLSSALSVVNGGTGATDAANAKSNLQTIASKAVNVSANYTLTIADSGGWVETDATSAAVTLTLPSSAGVPFGTVYSIRKADTSVNTVTIQTNGTDTVLGTSTYVLREQRQSITLINSTGGVWYILSSYIPTMDSFRNGGITFWHNNDSSTPVALTTYNTTGSERGLSVPQLRINNGRLDASPLSNKFEIRISGSSTAFDVRNTSLNQSYFNVGSDRTVNFFNTITSAGRIVVADTTASTSGFSGCATFAGGVGIAGSLNLGTALSVSNGGTGATTAAGARANLGLTQEYHYIQTAVPSSPSNRERWMEVDSNGTPIGQWYWDSTLSLWLSIAYVAFSGSSTTTALGTTFRPSVPINPGYTGMILEQMSIRCWSSVAHNSGSFFNISASRLNLNSTVSTTISSSSVNTQSLAAGVEQEYIIPLSTTQFTWPNFAGFQHNIQIGTGSPTMTFITNVRARYYR
jgi:hypothetical protein